SSSGHLVLSRHIFGIPVPALFFDTSVHIGTMLAVILVFREDIGTLLRAVLAAARSRFGAKKKIDSKRHQDGLRLAWLVFVGTMPTAILGAAIKVLLPKGEMASIGLVGLMMMVNAVLLWLTRGRGNNGRDLYDFNTARALLVGCAQGLAVTPGISRSGATIAVALLLGLKSAQAARLSFILSIPAILGAELLSAGEILNGNGRELLLPSLIGAVTAFGVGYLALRLLLRILQGGRLHLFAPYCLAAGLVALGSILI
ncbi:MAG: undecaprenyl-diphosphate phosphatase, partial [Desulfosudaceae bacterium]